MRCTVFGTGYLGATHAAGMAELGHDVVGIDIDPGKIAKLSSGEIPFYEPGLAKMLQDNLSAGRLQFTTDYDTAADFADVHFLGVGTPQKKGEYGADLRHVNAVIDELVPRLTRPAVIVGKSTVPVGTAAELSRRAQSLARDGVDVEIAWNPGVPARGVRGAGHPAPGPYRRWRTARFDARRGGVAGDVRTAARRGHSVPADRPADRRAGQGVGQCLSGDQDLVHQRHLRGV